MQVLDQLLVVLMLLETSTPCVFPHTLTMEGSWAAKRASISPASMIELGLLGVPVFSLVLSIALLHRNDLQPKSQET